MKFWCSQCKFDHAGECDVSPPNSTVTECVNYDKVSSIPEHFMVGMLVNLWDSFSPTPVPCRIVGIDYANGKLIMEPWA